MQISKCTLQHLQQLQQVAQQSFCETFAAVNKAEDIEDYLNTALSLTSLTQQLTHPSSAFYLLEVDQQPAGYLKLNQAPAQTEINDPAAIEIERIYLLQAYQRRRLGQALLDKAISLANEQHKSYLWLGVWEHNQQALAFYKKNGFYKIDQHHFQLGDDLQTDFILRKDL